MKKIIKLLVVSCLLVSLTACVKVKPYIAYTVYPLEYLINRISGGIIDAKSIQTDVMIQVAQVKDDYKDILNNSSYFFHIGELEPYYELYEQEFIESGVDIVDLSNLNEIYKFQRYNLVYVDGKEEFIEGPYYNSDDFSLIDVNENDMMIWIDPIGMLSLAKDITDTLSNNFVEEAKRFRTNYAELENDLIKLDAAYQSLSTMLKKESKTISFVSMSASFGNWQKAYGFQVYPICLSKYGTLPSQKQLDLIKKRIKQDNVKYIAYEPNMTEEMTVLFDSLVDELGLTRINLNNISSLTLSQREANIDYLSLMYENLSVLKSIAAGGTGYEDVAN